MTHRERIEQYLREGRTVSGGTTSYSAAGWPDYGQSTDPIVPDSIYNLDLPGQMENLPGGGITSGVTYIGDPAGISSISTNPNINPNPTGGWMTALTQTLQAATAGFTAYEKGSPSVAIPRPSVPNQSVLGKIFTPPVAGSGGGVGPFSWGALALIGVGVVALVVIAKAA